MNTLTRRDFLKAMGIGSAALASRMTLTACSQSQGSQGSSGSEGEIEEIIMQWPSISGTEEGLTPVEDAINAIIEPEYNIHVTFEPVQFSNLSNQTIFSVSAGESWICALR